MESINIQNTDNTPKDYMEREYTIRNLRDIPASSLRASINFFKPKTTQSEPNLSNRLSNTSENLRGSLDQFRNSSCKVCEDDTNPTATGAVSRESLTPTVKSIRTEKYKYIGELKDGKRHGFGVCYNNNGDKYTGYWRDDKREGLGKMTFANGKIFSGEFKDNHPSGFVEYINSQGMVHWGYMEHLKYISGEAIIIRNRKCLFEGVMSYVENKLCGIGTYKYSNGNKYEGETCDYLENGWGIYYRNDNYIFMGENKERVLNGYSEIYSPDQSKYFGYHKDGQREGLGINISPEGIYSIGKYKEDTKDGGFLYLAKGMAKFEMYYWDICVKTLEKKENIMSYVNTVYPEHLYLLKIDNKRLRKLLYN
jgi:hypothetical protein